MKEYVIRLYESGKKSYNIIINDKLELSIRIKGIYNKAYGWNINEVLNILETGQLNEKFSGMIWTTKSKLPKKC